MKVKLTATFSIIDMRSISFYLGLKIEHNGEKQIIKLSKSAYIDKILNKFYLNKPHLTTTPIKKFAPLQPYIKGQVITAKRKGIKI